MSSQVSRSLWRVFGTNLKAWRVRRGLTQEEAAHRCHGPYKRWQEMEAGRVKTTLTTLARIAHALRLPPADLLRTPRA